MERTSFNQFGFSPEVRATNENPTLLGIDGKGSGSLNIYTVFASSLTDEPIIFSEGEEGFAEMI